MLLSLSLLFLGLRRVPFCSQVEGKEPSGVEGTGSEWVPRDVGGDEKGPGGAGRSRTSLVASVSSSLSARLLSAHRR